MFFIPGFVIAMVTFPGVIVHELAHQFFCRLLKVPVFKVCYFRVGNPSGYVIHEPPDSPWKSLLIGIGPLFVNSLVGFLITFPTAMEMAISDSKGGVEVFLDLFLLWLGISVAMHSFPSTGDAQSIWDSTMKRENSLHVKIVAVPLVGLIFIGAIGSVFWLDAIYGVFIAFFLPQLIIQALAGM